jgi:hypothetical protein
MIHPATRRMYRRVPTDYQACYLTSSAFRVGVARDLSLNGFRIAGRSAPARGSVLMLRLWLPDAAGSIDIDQTVVRWATEREFGVQIISLSNDADLRLALHVERALRLAS